MTIPPQYRKPPQAYTAQQLHDMLDADALAHVATPIEWCVPAYQRIAEQRKITPDAAYREVVAAMATAGGYGMPM